jgi:large conductance mechanosensitive channel protein
MLQGFKNFLLRGDVIVVAVGLVIALAFSALITSFTANVINPIIQSLTGGKVGLGFQIRSGNPKTVVDLGAFITAIRALHLAGVDLRSTLQNPQVSPDPAPATPILAAGR